VIKNRCGVRDVVIVGLLALCLCGTATAAEAWKDTIEADWDRQASGGSIKPTIADKAARRGNVSTREDAWGAVDGVKNGGTGFHTQGENNPWWQIDLGKTIELNRVELTNREDSATRADRIMVLLSTNGKKWQKVYQHTGATFHGGPDKKPLNVALHSAKARYIRLTVPGNNFLHLDEVEVYAEADKTRNIALGRPCNQSSSSEWSTAARSKDWKKGGTPPKAVEVDAPEPKYAYKSTQLTEAIELAQKTLDYVQTFEKRPELAAKLKDLQARYAGDNKIDATAAYKQARWLRREIIMSHPLLKFNNLLINKRPPPGYSHQCDQYLGRHSRPGPGLTVLKDWKTAPTPTLLLEGKMPEGTVTHPDMDFDGKKILFAFCDHTETERSRRRFLIWEIGIDGKGLRQLTGDKRDKLKTWYDRETVLVEDFDPCYLPGGGFAFITTRGQAFGRCHGGRYTPNYLLYGADSDGGNIRQLSYGEANEWDPSVLNDGRIVYTRWDYINRHDTFYQSLWTTRPDGTATAHFYGNYTRNPCMIAEARAIPGSHKATATATAHHSYTTGSIIELDPRKGTDGVEPLKRITPETSFPETERGYPKGPYCTPWPLNEELYLVAYTPNQQTSQPRPQETNAYGIYLIDTLGGRELVYRDPDMSCFQPIPVQKRFKPPALPSMCVPDARHPMTGVFQISDVHMSVETLPAGSIKRIRVNQIHGQVTSSKPWLSTSNNEILKSIVGTAPVNADGSVALRAPAGEPLQLQLLDKDGMAVMTMRSFIYLHDGETQACIGCHEPRDATPPPPRTPQIVELTQPVGPKYTGAFSFARTVQPVLDRHCIGCHGLKDPPKGMNLLGTPSGRANLAHDSLVKDRSLVKVAYRNGETPVSKPKDYFAHAGRLAQHLLSGHKDKDGKPRVNLDTESFQRIVDWLDLNAQYYGDYSHNRPERRKLTSEGEKALRQHIAKTFGPALAAQPIDALVNIATPTESRVLKAPLAVKAGGWGQIDKGWTSTNDPGYKKTLSLIQAGLPPMMRLDVVGTCGSEGGRGCRCGGCWTREARAAYLKKTGARQGQ